LAGEQLHSMRCEVEWERRVPPCIHNAAFKLGESLVRWVQRRIQRIERPGQNHTYVKLRERRRFLFEVVSRSSKPFAHGCLRRTEDCYLVTELLQPVDEVDTDCTSPDYAIFCKLESSAHSPYGNLHKLPRTFLARSSSSSGEPHSFIFARA